MNIRQLFFISLIVLSIVMGMNWFKNKPKFIERQPSKPRQAVALTDLQLQEEEERKKKEEEEKAKDKDKQKEQGEDEEGFDEEGEEGVEEEGVDEEIEETEEVASDENNPAADGNELASDTADLNASDTLMLDNPLKDDPILQDYFKITRNPFETSPYAQLVEKLRLEAELAAQPEEKEEATVKKITKLTGNFSGTIETNRGLRAIIDGNLYLKGDEYQHHKITEINNETVIMDTEEQTFIIPKHGVEVNINEETGEYSITDTFED